MPLQPAAAAGCLKDSRCLASKIRLPSKGDIVFVAAASLFGWVLTTICVTEYMTETLLAYTNIRYVILLLSNVLLLVVRCFLEPVASISILVPVLMPVIVKVGMIK